MVVASYELLGTTKGRVRYLLHGVTVEEVRRKVAEWGFISYAIYKTSVNGRRFHNATDEDFLVEHFNDPYWLNRGVDSTPRSVQ